MPVDELQSMSQKKQRTFIFPMNVKSNRIALRVSPTDQIKGNEVKYNDDKVNDLSNEYNTNMRLNCYDTVTFVKVLRQRMVRIIQGEFVKIKTRDGIVGWVREKHIRTEDVKYLSQWSVKPDKKTGETKENQDGDILSWFVRFGQANEKKGVIDRTPKGWAQGRVKVLKRVGITSVLQFREALSSLDASKDLNSKIDKLE